MSDMMPRRFACLTLLFAVAVPACLAQDMFNIARFDSSELEGIHLYGVSVFTGYTSMAGPGFIAGQTFTTALGSIGGSTTYGAEMMLGWQRQRRTTVAARYTASYNGQTRYSNLNAFGHSMSLDVSRPLSSKWTVRVSANGQYMTAAQYLFEPSSLSVVSQLPGDPAITLGSISDPQIAAILTPWMTTSTVATTARSSLLGDRILTYGVQSSLTYAPSTRWTLTFSSVGAGGQSALDNNQSYVVPRTISLNAGVSGAYSLSPRTTIGFNVSENRSTNQFQAAYDTNVTAAFSRKMGVHWFLKMNGGIGLIKLTKQLYGTPPSHETIGGGAIGYKLFTHTFVASYNRSTFDTGIAAGLSAQALGAWTWHRPGSSWSLSSSFGQQQIKDAGFTGLSAWRGNIGFTRDLTSRTFLTAEYAYLDTTGTYLGITAHRTIHSVRLSLGWGPRLVTQ